MDTVSNLPDVATGVGAGAGALGLLAWLVVRVMGQSTSDRKEYKENLEAERKSCARRVEEYEERIRKYKDDLAYTHEQYEEERRLRRRAEDEAAQYKRMAGMVDYGRNGTT